MRELKNDITPNTIMVGTLKIDLTRRQVFKSTINIKLTSLEFNLLELLIKNPGERLSRSFILQNVWGYTPKNSS